MNSKNTSDKARMLVNSLLIDLEVSFVMRQIKAISEVTYEHSINTAFITAQILVQKTLSEKEIIAITKGALLHDIGKLKTPIWLLEKKDYLTEEEKGIIKKHPTEGIVLLKKYFEKPQSSIIQDIVRYHHAKEDGLGYPEIPEGFSIPWYVSLVRTVDAYEAMTAVRTYGNVYSREEALKLLKEGNFPSEMIYDILTCDIN